MRPTGMIRVMRHAQEKVAWNVKEGHDGQGVDGWGMGIYSGGFAAAKVMMYEATCQE